MKNVVIYILPTILIFNIIISCSPGYKSHVDIRDINRNDSIINIDLDAKEKGYIFYRSSLAKKVTPIVLEVTQNSLLGYINKFVTYKDYFLILDTRISKGVFVFDRQGKFLQRIGDIGEGPEEYQEPFDFTINEEDGLIYIIDGKTHRIYTYRLPDGEFVESVKLKDDNIISYYIQYYNGKLYADANNYRETNEDYMLREIDLKSGKQAACWLSNERYNKGYNGRFGNSGYSVAPNPFYSSPFSGPKFVQSFMDTIISINEKGPAPFLSISSKDLMTKELILKLKEGDEPVIRRITSTGIIYQIER